MKLEYNILWLDDNKEKIIKAKHHEKLSKYLDELGFEPFIELSANKSEFDTALRSQPDDWDLIIMDYNLTDDNKGDKIIEEVRKQFINTEIIFYSANVDVRDYIKSDRITCFRTSDRLDKHYLALINKTKELINLTVKKFQHIIPMRGLMISEAAQLEADMLALIKEYVKANQSSEITTNLQSSIAASLEEQCREKKKKAEKVKDLLKDPLLFSATERATALELICSKENFNEVSFKEFKEEFIKTRNIIAHCEYNKITKTFKGKDIEFNEELCTKLRKDIKKYKFGLDALKKHLEQVKEKSTPQSAQAPQAPPIPPATPQNPTP